MYPSVLGVPSYFLMWGIAAFVCTASGTWVASRSGFPSGRSFLALVLLVIPILPETSWSWVTNASEPVRSAQR